MISGEPNDDITADLWSYTEPTPSNPPEPSPDSEDEPESEGQDEDWDNLRDGSINRRPAWRRPSPTWVLFFIVGATISMGMCMAPRSEIYINLACLAHPPQQHRSSSLVQFDDSVDNMQSVPWLNMNGIQMNTSIPSQPTKHRSASDEWFIKLQHDIYEYKLAHSHSSSSNQSTSIILSPTSTASLPQPTIPSDRPPYDIPETTPPTRSPNRPYEEIDPELCKKDARVQAAAARLTMCKSYCLMQDWC